MVLRERIELSASHHWWGLYHELIDSYIVFRTCGILCPESAQFCRLGIALMLSR
jgi:hypothetical protein